MSTQNVIDKIFNDATNEAQAITKRYQEKTMNVKREFEQTIAVRRKDIEMYVEDIKRTEIARTIARARLQFNNQLVERKQHLINSIVKQALTTLNQHNEYVHFLKALIGQSALRTGELRINDKDWKKFGPTIEKFLQKEERSYIIVKDNTLSGGVTIQHERTTHHGSLDLIRELLREELTIAVSKQVR